MLSSCGVEGPAEPRVSTPVVNMHADLGAINGSTMLAAPPGWLPSPNQQTPVFAAAGPQLLSAMRQWLLAQPRTWLDSEHPDELQASFIVRSSFFNLPDVVVVQAVPTSSTTSQAIILSRSRYDDVPFISANKARVDGLVADLQRRFTAVPVVVVATPKAAAPVVPQPDSATANRARSRSRVNNPALPDFDR